MSVFDSRCKVKYDFFDKDREFRNGRNTILSQKTGKQLYPGRLFLFKIQMPGRKVLQLHPIKKEFGRKERQCFLMHSGPRISNCDHYSTSWALLRRTALKIIQKTIKSNLIELQFSSNFPPIR